MSAVEIEQTLLKHPSVVEAAVVGVPNPLRGQIAKAYIVAKDPTTGMDHAHSGVYEGTAQPA